MAQKKSGGSIVALAVLIGIPLLGFVLWKALFYFPHETIQPLFGMATDSVEASGEVIAQNWTAVSPKTSGEITKINIPLGQPAKKGEVLAEISNSKEKETLDEIKGSIASLEDDKQRLREQMKVNLSVRSQYDRVLIDLEQAHTELKAQESILDNYKILSPIDGTLLKQDVAVGQLVTPEKICFWVGNPKPIIISAKLDSSIINKVSVAQKVIITDAANPTTKLEGKVIEIGAESSDNLQRVAHISLPENADFPIRKQLKTEIIMSEKTNAILVPLKAIRDNTILVVKRNKVIPTPVQTGFKSSAQIEVTAGIKPDDKIIPDFTAFAGPPPAPANAPAATNMAVPPTGR